MPLPQLFLPFHSPPLRHLSLPSPSPPPPPLLASLACCTQRIDSGAQSPTVALRYPSSSSPPPPSPAPLPFSPPLPRHSPAVRRGSTQERRAPPSPSGTRAAPPLPLPPPLPFPSPLPFPATRLLYAEDRLGSAEPHRRLQVPEQLLGGLPRLGEPGHLQEQRERLERRAHHPAEPVRHRAQLRGDLTTSSAPSRTAPSQRGAPVYGEIRRFLTCISVYEQKVKL